MGKSDSETVINSEFNCIIEEQYVAQATLSFKVVFCNMRSEFTEFSMKIKLIIRQK